MPKPCTVAIIIRRVQMIRELASCDRVDAAHFYESKLYEELLIAIADGLCDNVSLCCKEALKTQEIGFSRWRAYIDGSGVTKTGPASTQ